MAQDAIAVAEFIRRRERVLEALKGAVGIVFAGDGGGALHGKWQADANFRYLTGIADEPGAAVLFDPSAENPKRRCILFLRPLNPEMERWDGLREEIGAALRERTGFQTVMRTTALPSMLTAAVRRAKRAACLHSFSVYDAPVSPDLAVLRKVAERVVGVAIEDRTQLLASMRAVKSAAELRMMRRAAEATAAGYAAAYAVIRPGAREADVQEALESGFRRAGGAGTAYNSIVGSGLNGTVLHYSANSGVLEEGDLLVIDAGANFGPPGSAYACDVTRTYPVSGTFSREQREVYETVLRAQEAAIRAARPGARLVSDVDGAARAVLEKAGYADAFIHGIGHQLGLEVHDITPDGPLKPGMVVTIEPGVYFPDRKMGIRIEDDILITRNGNENLTKMIPKSVDAVERALKGARGGGERVGSAKVRARR